MWQQQQEAEETTDLIVQETFTYKLEVAAVVIFRQGVLIRGKADSVGVVMGHIQVLVRLR
jgi:hypothetical protein